MRNLISFAFCLLITSQLYQSAFALDLSNPKEHYLLISGVIQKGDAEKLAKALIQTTIHNQIPFNLLLNSAGGDIEESLRIASLVKALRLSTVVADGGTCASACFFVWLAGETHVAVGIIVSFEFDRILLKMSSGYIGLHRPYLKLDPAKRNGSTDAEARQHYLMRIIREYLSNENVAQRLIDLMMSRSSNDIYWMTVDDINQLGTYSAGREELLISRCGYSKKLLSDVGEEMRSDDSIVVTHGKQRFEDFANCEVTAFPDLSQEVLKNTGRLQKGWRPWIKQKNADKTNK